MNANNVIDISKICFLILKTMKLKTIMLNLMNRCHKSNTDTDYLSSECTKRKHRLWEKLNGMNRIHKKRKLKIALILWQRNQNDQLQFVSVLNRTFMSSSSFNHLEHMDNSSDNHFAPMFSAENPSCLV